MISRKETHRNKNKSSSKIKKLIISSLVLIFMFAGTANIVFADQSISSLLKDWFSNEGEEMIDDVDQAIETEKNKQIDRLKKDLQSKVDSAGDELHTFTQNEIDKQVNNMQDYVDDLIADTDIDSSQQEQQVKQDLNTIFNNAVDDMKAVTDQEHNRSEAQSESKPSNEDTDSTESEEDNADEAEVEDEKEQDANDDDIEDETKEDQNDSESNEEEQSEQESDH